MHTLLILMLFRNMFIINLVNIVIINSILHNNHNICNCILYENFK